MAQSPWGEGHPRPAEGWAPAREGGRGGRWDSRVLLFLAKWKTKSLLRVWEDLVLIALTVSVALARGPAAPRGARGEGRSPSTVLSLLADFRRARWGLALRRSRPAQRGTSSLPPQPRACLLYFLGLRFLMTTRLWIRV